MTARKPKMKRMGRPVKGADLAIRSAPDLLKAVPDCPEYFNGDRQNIWEMVCNYLIQCEALTVGDLHIVEDYTNASAETRELSMHIAKHGHTRTNVQGNEVVAPEVTARGSVQRHSAQLAMALGLNPRARAQVASLLARTQDASGADPDEKLIEHGTEDF